MTNDNNVENSASIDDARVVEIQISKFALNWAIKDHANTKDRESPIFTIGTNEKLQWCIKLLDHEDVWPSLVLLPCDIFAGITVWHTFSIVDANGTRAITLPSIMHPKTILPTGRTAYIVDSKENRFLCKDVADNLLPNGKLWLRCAIDLQIEKLDPPADSSKFQIPACNLIDDLSHLLETQKLSDFTIKIKEEELLVHRSILSARSSVFAAMLEHEMSEKPNNQVIVEDVEADVFKEMLKFIYTGKAPNVKQMAGKLLAAAIKYDLERLKFICEEALRSSIDVNNVIDTLMLADYYTAEELKTYVIEFVVSNVVDVMATASFQKMVKSHSHLTAEILRALATKQEKTSSGHSSPSSGS